MKKLIILLSICISPLFLSAQEASSLFVKGTNNIGVGFGIGGAYGLSSISSQSPAFGIHFDHGIAEVGGGVIGIGGYLGYKTLTNKDFFYKQKWTYVMIGARGTYHYNLFEVDNLDTYAGVMLAYYALSYKDDYPSNYIYDKNYSGSAYVSILAGAKYYFNPNIAAFAEVGYGVSWLTIGAAFKF